MNFGENKNEYYNEGFVPVEQTKKYLQSKEAAEKIINAYESINEGDFWILKNYNKYKKCMNYTGLIISHNGCLKLNDSLDEELKFKPECVSIDKQGYANSLVYTYCCPEQGIYEVGEASPNNLKAIGYPYAMAFKRLYDRVVLKNSKLAYSGVYSEVEAEEFKQQENKEELGLCTDLELKTFMDYADRIGADWKAIGKKVGATSLKTMTKEQHGKALLLLKETEEANESNQ